MTKEAAPSPNSLMGRAQTHSKAVAKVGHLFLRGSQPTSAGSVHSSSWAGHLFLPVDVASIAVFRISFGLLLLYDVYRYFAKGWVKLQYIDPPYHFAFFGFDFIRPLPGDGMYWLFAALALGLIVYAVGLTVAITSGAWFGRERTINARD